MNILFLDLRHAYKKIKSRASLTVLQVHHALYALACQGPAKFLGKFIIKKRNWQPVYIGNITCITEENVTLAETGSSTIAAPCFNGDSSLTRSEIFPAVKAHVLQGGLIVTPYSAAVLYANQLFLPGHVLKNWKRIKTDTGELFALDDRFSVGRIDGTKEVDEGILIGGAGAFNWYHFIIEILPKAFLARSLPSRFDKLPLLVPDECRNVTSFSNALAYFSAERSLQFYRRGEFISVKRLIIIDEVSIGPFNLCSGDWSRINDYAQHDSVLRSFIIEFRLKVLGPSSHFYKFCKATRRIFLTRPGIRRNFNQSELIEIAMRYGFEPFSPEELSLDEQARIFAESSYVIGPSGAAWVGMVFRARPLRGLSWLPEKFEQFCGYSTLARLLGHQLEFIEAKTSHLLRSTEEAYTSDYEICPIEFESALKIMVGEK